MNVTLKHNFEPIAQSAESFYPTFENNASIKLTSPENSRPSSVIHFDKPEVFSNGTYNV